MPNLWENRSYYSSLLSSGQFNYQPPNSFNSSQGTTNMPNRNLAQSPWPFSAMFTTSQLANPTTVSNDAWYLDSGASHHLTPDLASLNNSTNFHGQDEVMVGDGKCISIKHIGSVALPTNNKPLRLCTILHTPEITKQLVSVSKLCYDNNAFVEFHPSFFLVKDQFTKKVLVQGTLEGGLYKFPSSSSTTSPVAATPHFPPVSTFLAQKQDFSLWHSRLGHSAPPIIFKVLKSCNVGSIRHCDFEFCSFCQFANLQRVIDSLSCFLIHGPRSPLNLYIQTYVDLPLLNLSMVQSIFFCLLMIFPILLGFIYLIQR